MNSQVANQQVVNAIMWNRFKNIEATYLEKMPDLLMSGVSVEQIVSMKESAHRSAREMIPAVVADLTSEAPRCEPSLKACNILHNQQEPVPSGSLFEAAQQTSASSVVIPDEVRRNFL